MNRKWKSPTTDGKGKNTKLYICWRGIKNRCNNPNATDYKNYGKRGIKLCLDWLDFDIFYNWSINNGYIEGLQIDRVETNGNYEPNNCRFVKQIINLTNKRVEGKVSYRGVSKHRKLNKYIASISINRKTIYIGTYENKEEAAKAFDNKVIELRGFEYIHMLNFPDDVVIKSLH